MNMLLRIITIIATTAALTAISPADVIHLENGNSVDGEIVKETDKHVKLKTPAGNITFKRSDIVRIERKASPFQQYKREAAELKDDDSVGHYFLGLWCKDNGLRKQAEQEFLKTIAANPDHADARKELGHVMHAGKWMTEEEAMKAKGFEKYEGRWVTRHEAETHRKAEEVRRWRRKLNRAARLMCDSKPGAARKIFEDISRDDDPDVVAPALRSITGHECALAREEAVKALARLRTPEAFEGIVEAVLNESDMEIFEVIVAALKGLNSKRGAKLLMQASRDLRKTIPTAANDSKPGIVRAIARASAAMGKLGEQMAVPELARALVLKIDYVQEVDSGTDINGPIGSSLTPGGPIVIDNGAVGLQTATTSGVSLSTSSKTTKVVKDYFNYEAATSLRRLTGERFDYDRRKYLEWWAAHKPIFPPEKREFELN